MSDFLTADIYTEVNRLVEAGAHFALAMHGVPLSEFGGLKATAWCPPNRKPYISSSKNISNFQLELYSVDLVDAHEVETMLVNEKVAK